MEDNVMIYRQGIVGLLDKEGLLAHSCCGCGSFDERDVEVTLYP